MSCSQKVAESGFEQGASGSRSHVPSITPESGFEQGASGSKSHVPSITPALFLQKQTLHNRILTH